MADLTLIFEIFHAPHEHPRHIRGVAERVEQRVVDLVDPFERVPGDEAEDKNVAVDAKRRVARQPRVLVLGQTFWRVGTGHGFGREVSDGLLLRSMLSVATFQNTISYHACRIYNIR